MPRIIYKSKDGKTRYKGVTTIIGEIWTYMKSKSLLDWSCGLAVNYEGGVHKPIYHEWERDRAGRIGTLAHEYVTNFIKTQPEGPKDPTTFNAEESKEAHRIYEIYHGWVLGNVNKATYLEHSMIDEKYQYGGTPDFIGVLKDGNQVILDWKTGYVDEISCLYQLSAYYNLCMVNHPEINVDKGVIVGLNCDKTKIKLTEYSIEEMLAGFDGFWHYLKAHHNRVKIEERRGK